MKTHKEENQLWAVCYSVAASLLTLGYSIRGNAQTESQIETLDERAAQIADQATKRLKRKLL